MFENVLGQSATGQLIEDIRANTLSRAMLFSGPPASGKGTAALELGRVISCEPGSAEWNCACPACARHRLLIHPDLLCMGRKDFSAEIAASAGAFLREAALPKAAPSPCRVLFIRSVRKLLLRFNPVLWEDDPKASKISPLVNSLEENLDELSSFTVGDKETPSKLTADKIVEAIKKEAFKLESEGMSETIPIVQLRRAAWWCRLAPSGRGKLLVIENADRMQEEGRNSMLKLLEEPSARLRIVLTSARPGSLLPTILSRLRPYRFNSRGADVEAEVIKRVFRDKEPGIRDQGIGNRDSGSQSERVGKQLGHPSTTPVPSPQSPVPSIRLESYLDSFLPVSAADLEAIASYFAASVAYKAAVLVKRDGRSLPEELVLLGKYSAPKAETAGLGRPKEDSGSVIAAILEKADKFEARSLFSRFLCSLLEQVSQSMTQNLPDSSLLIPRSSFFEIWARDCGWAESAVGTYKLRPGPVLEKLFTDLSRGMAEL
jgi:DNA polymerase-3 subunit gamma/tau